MLHGLLSASWETACQRRSGAAPTDPDGTSGADRGWRPVVEFFLPGVRSVDLRTRDRHPAADLKLSVSVVPAVLAQRPVREARNADGGRDGMECVFR